MADKNNNKKSMVDKFKGLFNWPIAGSGNVLDSAMPTGNGMNAVPDQRIVRVEQPYGDKKPSLLYDRTTGYSQIGNLSHNFTMEKVQGAFRAAENGDVRMLFTYYRDFFLGSGIVVAEISKRKLSTISEPFTLLPASKSPDDVKAAKVIEQLLNRCSSFRPALNHMMNSVVYPIAVIEKTFEPIDNDYDEYYGSNEFNLNYRIKELHAVSYDTITYRLPYIPQSTGHSQIVGNNVYIPGSTAVVYDSVGRPEDVIYNKDSWEPDLRFWSVLPNGTIIQAPSLMISPDPDRHIIYRSNLLNGIARDNFGGLGKSLLFLAIMSQMGLDVFLRCLQKFGSPFIVAKVDMQSTDIVNQIMEAFGNLNVLNAIAVNKDAMVELQEMNFAGAADAHSRFLEFINDQISLLISGQVLSSHARAGGLGNGAANLQASVREDIIKYDRLSLNDALQHGLFKQLLQINNIKGEVPKIVWGGSSSTADNLALSTTIENLHNAGIEVSDESMDDLSTQLGFIVFKNNNSTNTNPNKINNISNKPDKNEIKNPNLDVSQSKEISENKIGDLKDIQDNNLKQNE